MSVETKIEITPEHKAISDAYNKLRDETRCKEQKIHELERTVQNIQKVVVRSMVVLKHFLRVAAVVAAYLWIGKTEAMQLAGFIFLTGLVQLAIDKVRMAVNPKLHLSEWDVL